MSGATSPARLSLAGRWQFSLSEPPPPLPQAPLPVLALSDTIDLPGTTETNRKGADNPAREVERLTRIRHFDGPAWYQRTIRIPDAWQGMQVRLFLERTKFTAVWLDGRPVGTQALYCVPQVYDLGCLAPGEHALTLMVDNHLDRRPVPCWDAHQYSDNTQTNWNGILGRIELQALQQLHIEDVQVHPNVPDRAAMACVTIANSSGRAIPGTLALAAVSWNHDGPAHIPPPVRVAFCADGALTKIEVLYPLGKDARLWDEFDPTLYKLTVSMLSQPAADCHAVDFGLREFGQSGGQFVINGRTTFLRGKHDGCVFPLTGHPPMDVDGWMKYLSACQEYGINHIRCHTWTPPEAALTAADRLGVYFQPELPFWGEFKQSVYDGLMPEAERILRDYGNHPSFVMMTLGNELIGDRALMERMVRALRALDPRRLYACGSNNHHADPRLSPSDDFWATMYTRLPDGGDRLPVRGSFFDGDGAGIIQNASPDTRRDYRASLAGIPVPVVGHEVAQYSMYPDLREIPKYTGVVAARNFEIFRERLSAAGMLDQADDFMRASGILSSLCYREEIEMALRTPGFGGFQLLDLQDFPGQGTAIVGILNALMDSKGLITPDAWRRFCSPVVPLARFDKFTWTTAETFTADVEIAHYGEKDLAGATLAWTLRADDGLAVARGELPATTLRQGGLRPLGAITIPLSDIPAPQRATLELRLHGTAAANAYPIWVYPAQPAPRMPSSVMLSRSFNGAAQRSLAQGGRVLLIPESGSVSTTVGGGFTPDFWCWKFGNKPGTTGLLCQPHHPALARFPTEFHSNWQWFHLAMNSQPVTLNETPPDYRPTVQVIDNIHRNHKLGLIFESRVAGGRLLVCATDLVGMQSRPEARQLLESLAEYAASDLFRPSHELPLQFLRHRLRAPLQLKLRATASSAKSDEFDAAKAVDGSAGTRWCAGDGSVGQWLQVDLGEFRAVDGCKIQWERPRPDYGCILAGSADALDWTRLSEQPAHQDAAYDMAFPSTPVRFLRVTVTALPKDRSASIRELKVFGDD